MGTRTHVMMLTALLAFVGWAAGYSNSNTARRAQNRPAAQTASPTATQCPSIATLDGGLDPEGARWIEVCVAPGDRHYHRGICRPIAGHGTLTTLADAHADGLTPCPVCMPVIPRVAAR